MRTEQPIAKGRKLLLRAVILPGILLTRAAAGAEPVAPLRDAVLLTIAGQVDVAPAGTAAWAAGQTNQFLKVGDHLRTGKSSRATLRLSDLSVLRVYELTTLEIQPPPKPKASEVIDVKSGATYFFNRDKPKETQFRTPSASGAIRGTEFVLQVDEDGATKVSLFNGEVDLQNAAGEISIKSGEEAVARPGQPPVRTAAIVSTALIQWCLYYPGVLRPDDLDLGDARNDLQVCLRAYSSGDLTGALAAYPPGRTPATDAERLYRAALLLSVGNIHDSRGLLESISSDARPGNGGASPRRLAQALQRMIAAVTFQSATNLAAADTKDFSATEWMVESYCLQSQYRLEEALAASWRAVKEAPDFAFGWERVAELDFGFGRMEEAETVLEESLRLAPRNAQGVALRGFLLAARNKIQPAAEEFGRAIALDGSLGNGWLGRGLCRFRMGEVSNALEDIEVAAAVEPQRALLRSYLAKVFGEAGATGLADHEIALAKQLDPGDPTAWLYAGLLLYRENQDNASIRDLEKSVALNDNRGLFRSRLLLDQDQAVRNANLATVYHEAGLTDYSLQTAARAVDSDYANFSAHQFLADSYDALRDPRGVNLRYETPWFNELLLANLLAPPGAGSLSQYVSQQEYSRLLQHDGVGGMVGTEYLSTGDWMQSGSVYGSFGKTDFSLDGIYDSFKGDRPNDGVEQHAIYAKIREQITARDTLFLQLIQYHNNSGDTLDHYDPASASKTLRFSENQEPNIYLGWHREWSPWSHTLFLAARLEDKTTLGNSSAFFPLLQLTGGAPVAAVYSPLFNQTYQKELKAGSTELEQLLELDRHTLVAGGRAQFGTVNATSREALSPLAFPPLFFGTANPALSFARESASAGLDRFSLFAYDYWQIVDPLRLVGGVSYDTLSFPNNADIPPLATGSRNRDALSPKVALIWDVTQTAQLRAIYARSLGGSYYDTSVRLEPTELAGFIQTYRSAIPESVAGQVPGSRFETWGLALDKRFPTTGTYLLASLDGLSQRGDRLTGVFNYVPPAAAAQLEERLNYQETAASLTLNQLVGEEWAFAAKYSFAFARLLDSYPALSPSLPTFPPYPFLSRQDIHGLLHELDLQSIYNHRSGFFASVEGRLFSQSSGGYTPGLPGDTLWQMDAATGYRFYQRRATIRLAVLNLTDQDYRLNPLNLHPDLPRRRTLDLALHVEF
jgi:Flp pilus assembly protein TadD